jgi:hypothetical protein
MLKFTITEEQRKSLLLESISNDIKDIQEESVSFVSKVINDTKEQIGVNLSMLLTWGASIGGFISPVMKWLQGVNPELSDTDISLIATSIICVLFYENKKTFKQLVNELKKRKIYKDFKLSLNKSLELRDAFFGFLKSLNVSVHTVSNMLSYAFLVPILPIVFNMVQTNEITPKDINMLVRSIASFGLITLGGNYIKTLFDKIIERFKN